MEDIFRNIFKKGGGAETPALLHFTELLAFSVENMWKPAC